jgi:crotonobetainyl-CoA:carnitine CoA-transferase CaiB-like acyl-CoA transferase
MLRRVGPFPAPIDGSSDTSTTRLSLVNEVVKGETNDMTGPLGGVRVLDLTSGTAGPMATMMLADHGADVIKIEPIGGDPTRSDSGARVWHRGKRSIELNLASDSGLSSFLELIDSADVLVENFAPGVTDQLGIGFSTVSKRNPRLIHCSITAYGRGNSHSQRPAIDSLVAARTGLQWEQRGYVGGTIGRLCGLEPFLADLEIPEGCAEGPERDGPMFSASRWPSLGAAFLATTGISAALRAREHTGRGQWVETSLLQGVLVTTIGGWQRPENPQADGYLTWIFDPRGTKGEFKCADGRWIHHWVPNPNFILGVSSGERIDIDERVRAPHDDPSRIGPGQNELVVLAHYYPELAAAFAKFPADEWTDAAAKVGVALQPVRSPEEALADAALLADGMVVEVDDPEVGTIRHVGIVTSMSATPASIQGPAPTIGQHTAEILAELEGLLAQPSTPKGSGIHLGSPLEGVVVLDLGLAVAGPFGAQLLSDLGATVIKINTVYDQFWHSTHIAFCCNRGKQSISVNLKDPRGMELLHLLVAHADVVHHNMRYEAAVRLGVDHDSLSTINPSLIYCHTSGFDSSRASRPGNDQTGASLAGVEWEDGGCTNGGKPIWSLTSLGDTGNGFLSAIAVIQALYHRDLTGEGQFVSTSILGACLLNTSYVWTDAAGNGVERPHLDADQTGFGPLHRIYRTNDGWLCLAVLTDGDWNAFAIASGNEGLLADDRFRTGQQRDLNAADLARHLEQQFLTRSAVEWFELLDRAGVPCEISSEDFALRFFDDPEMKAAGLTVNYEQGLVGNLDQFGLLWQFSDTPARIAGPPLVVGHDSETILRDLGISESQIQSLVTEGIVVQAPRSEPVR